MGPTNTGLLILAIIVILGSIAFTIQRVEERRRERKLLIMSLKSQIRQALNMYSGLPEMFMSQEIHDFLSKFALKKWRKLEAVDSSEETRRAHAAFQAKVKNKIITQTHPSSSMSVYQDSGQVYHALGQLKEMTNWLGELSKTKQITEEAFNELGWQTKDFYDRVSCDIEIFEAIDIEKQHGASPAFHRFQSVIKSLESLNQSEALDSQIYAVNRHIESLRAQIAAQQAEQEALDREQAKDSQDDY